MRLLYVVHQFFPDCRSGTEQYCLALARAARAAGHEPTVLSLHWDHDRDWPAIRLFEQPYDGLRVLRLNHWRRINANDVLRDYQNRHLDGWFRAVLDDVRPDAVHFLHLRQLGSQLIDVAKAAGARTVVNLMDFWFLCPRFTLLRGDGSLCDGPPDGGLGCVRCHCPELAGAEAAAGAPTLTDDPPARLRALLDRKDANLRALALADAVVAPSRFLAGMFARNGFPADRVAVVPYGLPAGRAAAHAAAPGLLRRAVTVEGPARRRRGGARDRSAGDADPARQRRRTDVRRLHRRRPRRRRRRPAHRLRRPVRR
jgi:hypothetical protein